MLLFQVYSFKIMNNEEPYYYIEDITRRREDMTYLRVVKTIFYERAQRVSTVNIVFNRRRAYFSV